MTEAVHAALRGLFGDRISAPVTLGPSIHATFDPSIMRELFTALRDREDLAFEHLSFVSGVDRGDAFEVVYGLASYRRRDTLLLKARLDRQAPKIASIHDLYEGAGWHERETFDLFGIEFEGHPDLRRLLMPDDWEGFPLRKDYQEAASYHGIPTSRTARRDGRPA